MTAKCKGLSLLKLRKPLVGLPSAGPREIAIPSPPCGVHIDGVGALPDNTYTVHRCPTPLSRLSTDLVVGNGVSSGSLAR